MTYKKIALINPPIDDNRFRCIDAGHWQPLNLIALASYLRYSGYCGEIRIFDQEIMSEKEIVRDLLDYLPDLVGISPNIDSYNETLKLANIVKRFNATVVLGGNYASSLAENILLNRKEIDFIIKRDGEIPFCELVFGKPLNSINNLLFRKEDKFNVSLKNYIVENPTTFHKVATISELDFSLIDLEPYFNNYSNHRYKGVFNRPIAFLSQRGCVWKDQTGGCVFCSRELLSRFDNTSRIWARIRDLKCKYGIDSIMDVGDDFLGNLNWFNSFYDSRPDDLKDIGIRFIYSRVNHINHETVKKLKDLNTYEVFLGIESGDQKILKNTIKGNSLNQQRKAIDLLEQNDINVALGFVIGLPGENEKSLEATEKYIYELLEHQNITELIVSIMTPLPGSPSYELMLNDIELNKKYKNKDIFSLVELQKDWVTNFCNVGMEKIIDLINRVNSYKDNIEIEFITLNH